MTTILEMSTEEKKSMETNSPAPPYQEKDPKPEDESVQGLFTDFLSNTSAHGLPKVAAEKSKIRKVIWLAIFIVAMGYFIFQFTKILDTYFRYPIAVKTEVLHRTKVEFPSVTVCNINKLKSSTLAGTQYWELVKIDQYNKRELEELSWYQDVWKKRKRRSLAMEDPNPVHKYNLEHGTLRHVYDKEYNQILQEKLARSQQSVEEIEEGERVLMDRMHPEDLPELDNRYKKPYRVRLHEYLKGKTATTDNKRHQRVKREAEATTAPPFTNDMSSGSSGMEETTNINPGMTSVTEGNDGSGTIDPNTASPMLGGTVGSGTDGPEDDPTDAPVPGPTDDPTPDGGSNPENDPTDAPGSGGSEGGDPATGDDPKDDGSAAGDGDGNGDGDGDDDEKKEEEWNPWLEETHSGSGTGPHMDHWDWEDEMKRMMEDGEEDMFGDMHMMHEDEMFQFEDTGFLSGIEDDFDFEGFLRKSSTPDLSDLTDVLKPTREELDEHGHQADEFIIQCSFDNKKCSNKDFKKSYNSKYGLCYTYNAGDNNTIVMTSKFGSRYGLRLTLNIQVDEYIGMFSHSLGARIAVHPHNVSAFPQDRGIDAPPGMKTSIGLNLNRRIRQKTPYSTNCTDGENVALHFPGVYNVINCGLSCLQQKLKNRCGCVDAMITDASVPHCSTTNRTQELCRQQVYYLYDMKKLGCNCRPSCHELNYESSVSSNEWPSMLYNALLLQRFDESFEGNNFDKQYVTLKAKENLVRAHIYFEDFGVISIDEYPEYPWEKLCADIGGLLGLFMGVSICTAIEFAEFLMDISLKIGHKLRCTKKKSAKVAEAWGPNKGSAI